MWGGFMSSFEVAFADHPIPILPSLLRDQRISGMHPQKRRADTAHGRTVQSRDASSEPTDPHILPGENSITAHASPFGRAGGPIASRIVGVEKVEPLLIANWRKSHLDLFRGKCPTGMEHPDAIGGSGRDNQGDPCVGTPPRPL